MPRVEGVVVVGMCDVVAWTSPTYSRHSAPERQVATDLEEQSAQLRGVDAEVPV
jgi:hypothetical protein